jgi:hypothetical protein
MGGYAPIELIHSVGRHAAKESVLLDR